MKQAHLKFKIDSEGKLIPASELDAGKLFLLIKNNSDNNIIDAYLTIEEEDSKTLGQLAKVHVLIKELAMSTGNSVSDVKLEVKKRAGLWYCVSPDEYHEKSFADCSKKELSSAIQVCIELGHSVGCYLD